MVLKVRSPQSEVLAVCVPSGGAGNNSFSPLFQLPESICSLRLEASSSIFKALSPSSTSNITLPSLTPTLPPASDKDSLTLGPPRSCRIISHLKTLNLSHLWSNIFTGSGDQNVDSIRGSLICLPPVSRYENTRREYMHSPHNTGRHTASAQKMSATTAAACQHEH